MNFRESLVVKKGIHKAQAIALKATKLANRFTNPADVLGASFIGINNVIARANPVELAITAVLAGLTAVSQIKQEDKKEFFFKSVKTLGFTTGSLMMISNYITPTVARIAQIAQGKTDYTSYLVSRYPLPPDPISALNIFWLEEGVNNGLKLLNIPLTGDIQRIILTAGILAGPIILGLSAFAKTSFPKKNKN